MEAKLEEDIKKHGQSFTQKLPVEEIVDYIKGLPNWNVPLTSATLGTLLAPDNQEMVNVFGKDHLKSLSFFFCTVGDKKIGMNYRNNLAHWIGLRGRDINSMLVAKLFFLYTDVTNTIFWYFFKGGWDELEQ